MKNRIDKLTLYILPILIIGIYFNFVSFGVLLAIFLVRLIFTDKHTAGIFLLMFGGAIGGYVRYKYPFLPVYGYLLLLIGIYLLRDLFYNFKNERKSITAMSIVLLYFFLAYILSPNVGDYGASKKIHGIIENGLFMIFGYYALIRSPKIDNTALTQNLLLVSILFIVYNMDFLGIRPSGFFDYEWIRNATERLSEDEALKIISYQTIGMDALFGISIFLSQMHFKRKYAFIYGLLALQLILTSGARQAIFGFFIILVLRFGIFNESAVQLSGFSNKARNVIIACIVAFFSLSILQYLGISYIAETFSEGDSGREGLRLMAYSVFLKYPIFGAGVGGFNHAYPGMMYPHNFFLEVLCECGIVGSLFLLIMVVAHFKNQKINLLYLTNTNSFLFLVVAALFIRVMVSDDLKSSIVLFSAVFACSASANGKQKV